jgi:hypothetical protein
VQRDYRGQFQRHHAAFRRGATGPTDAYEIHVQQNFSSAGTEVFGMHNYLPIHFIRVYCDEAPSILTSAEHEVKAYAHSNQLNASVTIPGSMCAGNKFSITAHIYGPGNTTFTSPLALSINKLETQAPAIPAWENPNLDACTKKALMEAAGHPVPFSISLRCELMKVS